MNKVMGKLLGLLIFFSFIIGVKCEPDDEVLVLNIFIIISLAMFVIVASCCCPTYVINQCRKRRSLDLRRRRTQTQTDPILISYRTNLSSLSQSNGLDNPRLYPDDPPNYDDIRHMYPQPSQYEAFAIDQSMKWVSLNESSHSIETNTFTVSPPSYSECTEVSPSDPVISQMSTLPTPSS